MSIHEQILAEVKKLGIEKAMEVYGVAESTIKTWKQKKKVTLPAIENFYARQNAAAEATQLLGDPTQPVDDNPDDPEIAGLDQQPLRVNMPVPRPAQPQIEYEPAPPPAPRRTVQAPQPAQFSLDPQTVLCFDRFGSPVTLQAMIDRFDALENQIVGINLTVFGQEWITVANQQAQSYTQPQQFQRQPTQQQIMNGERIMAAQKAPIIEEQPIGLTRPEPLEGRGFARQPLQHAQAPESAMPPGYREWNTPRPRQLR